MCGDSAVPWLRDLLVICIIQLVPLLAKMAPTGGLPSPASCAVRNITLATVMGRTLVRDMTVCCAAIGGIYWY